MNVKARLLDEAGVKRTLVRISHEIVERNNGYQDICLIGIKRRGVPLAKMIANNIQSFEKIEVPVGILDITRYRDDLTVIQDDALVKPATIDFSIDKKRVILVDDVLYTGRTAN